MKTSEKHWVETSIAVVSPGAEYKFVTREGVLIGTPTYVYTDGIGEYVIEFDGYSIVVSNTDVINVYTMSGGDELPTNIGAVIRIYTLMGEEYGGLCVLTDDDWTSINIESGLRYSTDEIESWDVLYDGDPEAGE